MKHAILTVLGTDRPGIIALVTGILFRQKCNLEDISMTILEGEFVMMLVLDYARDTMKQAVIRDLTAVVQRRWGLAFYWRDLGNKRLKRGEKHLRNSDSYLVSVMGKDRIGIVHRISKAFAECQLNITDLNSKILGTGKKSIYAMMLEVDIPKRFNIKRLEQKLRRLERRLRLELKLRPLERVEL